MPKDRRSDSPLGNPPNGALNLISVRTFPSGDFLCLCLIAIAEFVVNKQALLSNEKLSASRLLSSYDFFIF